MADIIEIDAAPREGSGKGAARAIRRQGLVPGVVYGAKKEPMKISLDPLRLFKELNTGHFFLNRYNLTVDGDIQQVMPRDVQFHPVSEQPLHVDFLRVTGKTRITIDIPCEFTDEEECEGLERGGVLNVVRHEIEVHTTVDNIPEQLVFSLKGLDIGDSVHISNTAMPEGVTPVIDDRDFTVATIASPTAVRDEAAEEQEGEEGEEIEGEEGEDGAEGEEGAGGDGGDSEEKDGE